MLPRHAFASLLLLVSCASPLLAGAQDTQDVEAPAPPGGAGEAAPPAAPATRVAVILLATHGVDPGTADDLTEVLVSALAERGGFSIVGKEEFQAQLGQSERGSLECIGSVACIGQVGVQLGVEQAIAGTIALRDGTYVFNLNRIDVRSGDTVGRAFREVRGDLGAVATQLQQVLPTLFDAIQRPATIVVSSVVGAEVSVDGLVVGTISDAAHPVRTGDLPPGRHEVIVRAAGRPDYRRDVEVASGATLQLDASPAVATTGGGGISPLLWIGGGIGIAALATGIVFGALSQDVATGTMTRAQLASFYADRTTFAITADIAYGVAGAGAIVALIGLVMSLSSGGGGEHAPEAATPRARLDVTPLRGGLGVSLTGDL